MNHLCSKDWEAVARKGSVSKVFSCEFGEIFKNTFFYRTAPVAVSEDY